MWIRPSPHPNQFAGWVCETGNGSSILTGALNLKKLPSPDRISRHDLEKTQKYQNITASSLGTKIVIKMWCKNCKIKKFGYCGSASFATLG